MQPKKEFVWDTNNYYTERITETQYKVSSR